MVHFSSVGDNIGEKLRISLAYFDICCLGRDLELSRFSHGKSREGSLFRKIKMFNGLIKNLSIVDILMKGGLVDIKKGFDERRH